MIGFDEAESILREHPRWAAVRGYFDPLLASHARRLKEVREQGEGLIVFLADPERPLIPAQSRAELLAALAMLDYVVLPDSDRSFPSLLISEEDADTARFQDLVRRVQERHRRD